MPFDDYMEQALDKISAKGLLRQIRPMEQSEGLVTRDGRRLVNLASNDYLGLGQDNALRDEFIEELSKNPCYFSSSGSALLTGAHESYKKFTDTIEKLYPGRQALLFNSGFAANSGVIRSLCEIPGTLVLADKLSHASIIDGLTAQGKSKFMRFAHNDAESLSKLIADYGEGYERILVVTESVFSMDGDVAPLKEIARIKKSNPKVSVYVDEAHGFCVYGPKGRGMLWQEGVDECADFVLCTCGKALGSEGAFVLCSKTARDYFINTVRPLIFSTAIAPVCLEHSAFMLKKSIAADDRRKRLSLISSEVRDTLKECGIACPSTTQIVPFILGENEKAVEAAEIFRENGFLAMPVRYPAVAKGSARLRLSLSSAIDDCAFEDLLKLIRKLGTSY